MRSRRHPNPIPENVRTARQRLGLTQEQLAHRAGVSVGTVARLEQGITRRPRDDEFDRIAAALGTTIEALECSPEPGVAAPELPGLDSDAAPVHLHFGELRDLVGQIERELGDDPELAEALVTSLRAMRAMIRRAAGSGARS